LCFERKEKPEFLFFFTLHACGLVINPQRKENVYAICRETTKDLD
jgi:hypothetical protein